jgi:multicomponent Na+:H+ antiporter subunit E
MAFQILLNLVLALTWSMLNNNWSIVSLGVGYMLGLILLYLFRKFFSAPFYVKRFVSVFNLLILFFKELVLSNISVIKDVLNPRLQIQPGIFALPIDVKTDVEITTLANLISLTPGTLTVDVSHDNKILYIHALHVPDAEAAIKGIKDTFEKRIMEVTQQ